MRYFPLLFFISFLGFTIVASPAVAILLGLVMATLLFLFLGWVQRRLFLRRLSSRIDNVYIVGETPNRQRPRLKKFYGLIEYASSTRVESMANRWRTLVRKSNNQTKIEVLVFRFQDGAHVNETFVEYEERILNAIAEDRVARHKEFKKDAEWYTKYHHGERVKFTTHPVQSN